MDTTDDMANLKAEYEAALADAASWIENGEAAVRDMAAIEAYVNTLVDELRRLARHVVEVHRFGMGTNQDAGGALLKHADRVLDETQEPT